jgi:hypothetical protein
MPAQITGVLDHTFPCASTAAIVKRRVVVHDASTRGNVKLPAGTPEKTAVGITLEDQSPSNNVAVQLEGIAIVESDGSAVINPGDWLIAVGTTGQVKTQALSGTPANYYNVIGQALGDAQYPATAGALVSVHICKFLATAA